MPIGLGIAASGVASGAMGLAGSAMAADAAAKAAAQQLAWTKEVYGNAKTDLQPYMALGQQGVAAQQAALPGLTAPYTQAQYRQSPLYTPMVSNLAELQATPGYQFQLQQGQQAINNSAAAQGGMLSGATQQALANYSQNQAATGFANAWTRAQGAYQSAFNNNQAQNLQASNINTTTAGMGQAAAQNLGSIGVGASSAMAPTSALMGQATGQMASAGFQGAASGLGSVGSYLTGIGNGTYNNPFGANGLFGSIGSDNQGLSGMTLQGAGFTPTSGNLGAYGASQVPSFTMPTFSE